MSPIKAVSFTATRDLDRYDERVYVKDILKNEVPEADEYITGGCVGGDAYIGRTLYALYPNAHHTVIVPNNWKLVDPWWLTVDGKPVGIFQMPDRSSYRERNQQLVLRATLVYGFPAYPEAHGKSKRSGTWQTIRASRTAGNFVKYYCTVEPHETGE